MRFLGVATGIIILSIFSCTTKKVVTPSAFEGQKIMVSHGGGFTGKYTTYCLLENGQLFSGEEQFKALNPMPDLDKQVCRQLFSNYFVLGLNEMELSSYGNLTYGIVFINKDGEQKKLIWGNAQDGTEVAQLFYDNVMRQIKLNSQKIKGSEKQ